jgi:hypothetical protein
VSVVRVALTSLGIMAAIAVAKVAQYASADAFGDRLGFNWASFLGVAPVIAIYWFAAAKRPDLFKFEGKQRG